MPDSTPPKPQTREIASIVGYGRDITRSYLGKLLVPQDKVLARKWFDYEVYEDLLRDDQVKSVFQQRRSAVIAREWDVVPGGDKRIDKQAAEDIRATLDRMGWDNVADKMLFGVFYGYAIGECLWAREGNKIQLTTIKVRKQRRFKFDWDMKPRLITWANNYEGEALPEYKFWHYSTGADNDDDPYGLGLAHWLYWPTYFKRNGIKSWLKFLERFAQPTAKGTYGPGAEAAEKAALKQALQAFGEDAAVMVPEGVAIELIEAARSGTADYGGLCDRMDAAIAKIILSQTMTTDNGSSKSQAEVHKGVALDVIKADADLIDASANNTWVKWLTDWNFPGAAYPRISRKLEDEENLNDRAARDKSLSEMGFRLTPEKVVEIYGDGYYDPASLEDESADQPPLVSVLGVGGTEALVGFLTALSQMSLKRENAIATLTTVFGISQSDAEAMVPEDAAPEDAPPPASIDDAAALFSEAATVEVLDSKLFGVLQSLDRAAGDGEFAESEEDAAIGRRFVEVLAFGEQPDDRAFATVEVLDSKLFGVLQSLDRAAGDGEFAESEEDAAIGRRFVEVLAFGEQPDDRAFAVLQVLDQSVEVDMLTFAETQSNVAMEGAIGRRLLALIRPGVVDFASGGGKKCTKGLSCGGSCISKAKVCIKAMNPAQKKQYGAIVKAVKAGGDGADKALEDFKATLGGKKVDAKVETKKTDDYTDLSDLNSTQQDFVAYMKDLGMSEQDIQQSIDGMKAANKTEKELFSPFGLGNEPMDDGLLDLTLDEIDAFDPIAAGKAIGKSKKAKAAKSKNTPEYDGEGELIDAAGDFLLTGKTSWVDAKMQKMQAVGMTQAEAAAVSTWMGTETYSVPGSGTKSRYSFMNQAIYAKDSMPPEFQAKIEATNQLAINGYRKIPAITPEVVSQLAQQKGEEFDPSAPLQRHLKFDDPAAFIQKYKDSIGKDVVEDIHFATTHKQELDWVQNDSNVSFRVVPKWDGTGQGRYIDNFKNGMSEGEIMFIPGTKFRVKNVIEPGSDNKPPKKPPNYVELKELESISNAISVQTFGGGNWQAAYKKKHGKDAFDALPDDFKKAKSKGAAMGALGKYVNSAIAHEAEMAEYNGKYIVELEEV